MVSQNRILTVSYGTFSCTLEGFDDPFGTMKAIAEYFRDLAAEDRYFGAEPPQPDAAMLHRIAEREIQRRVEAKIQDNGNGVILRAAEDDRPHPVARPLPMPEPAARVSEPAAPAVETVAPVAVAPALAEPAPRLRPVDDGVAAKLARIRAAVDRTRSGVDPELIEDLPAEPSAVPVADLIDDLPEDQPEDQPAPDGIADDAPAAVIAGDAAAWQDDLADELEAGGAAPDAPLPAADTAESGPDAPLPAAEAADVPPEADPQPEGAAHQDMAEPSDEADVAVAQARPATNWRLRRQQRRQRRLAAEAAQKAEADLAAAQGIVPDAASAEPLPATDDPAEEPAAPADAPDLAAVATAAPAAAEPVDFDLDALEAALEDIAAEVASPADVGTEPPAAEALATVAEAVAPVEPVAPAAAVADPVPDDVAALISRLSAAPAATPAPLSEAAPEPAPAPSPAEPAAPPAADAPVAAPDTVTRVRVVKVRRAVPPAPTPEPEALAPRAPLAEPEPMAPTSAAAADAEPLPASAVDVALPDQDLSEPAEAAALRDAVPGPAVPVRPSRPAGLRPSTPRPFTPRPDAVPVAPPVAGAAAPTRPVRPERPSERRGMINAPAASGEAQVDRLLRQADSEMAGAETRRRTSTIAHLKAAVAATVADRLTPRTPDAQPARDETAAYRSDLANAVRPQRPSASPDADQPPSRVAPLVLVSAQRVDRPAAAAAPAHVPAAMSVPSRPRAASAATAIAYDPQDEDEDDDTPAANLFGGVGGFSDWLQAAPPADLAARLEAAGAWLMAAEGLDGFNRPQLMRLAAADEAAETREAAMAAFGALLRDGRIVKARRGMFMLPEGSSMLARARKAAG